MTFEVPTSAISAGFAATSGGVHSSKTIMLPELRLLMANGSASATTEQYRAAVVEENALLKNTATTRRESYSRLRQLYALDGDVILFHALRWLWDADEAAQPLIAVLCATARDPLLRASCTVVLDTSAGEAVTREQFAEAVNTAYPGRYNRTTLKSIGQHLAATWQQSGHLVGKLHKSRSRVAASPAATAYALLLGYLCGERGMGLFTTLWARLLDASPGSLDAQAFAAAQRGWLDYRRIGDIADIGFSSLLAPVDGEGSRG